MQRNIASELRLVFVQLLILFLDCPVKNVRTTALHSTVRQLDCLNCSRLRNLISSTTILITVMS